jgi:hypothetical protein
MMHWEFYPEKDRQNKFKLGAPSYLEHLHCGDLQGKRVMTPGPVMGLHNQGPKTQGVNPMRVHIAGPVRSAKYYPVTPDDQRRTAAAATTMTKGR